MVVDGGVGEEGGGVGGGEGGGTNVLSDIKGGGNRDWIELSPSV